MYDICVMYHTEYRTKNYLLPIHPFYSKDIHLTYYGLSYFYREDFEISSNITRVYEYT